MWVKTHFQQQEEKYLHNFECSYKNGVAVYILKQFTVFDKTLFYYFIVFLLSGQVVRVTSGLYYLKSELMVGL